MMNVMRKCEIFINDNDMDKKTLIFADLELSFKMQGEEWKWNHQSLLCLIM